MPLRRPCGRKAARPFIPHPWHPAMRPVKSLDVFATLISRRCGPPKVVLRLLEERVGLHGLAEARLATDRAGTPGVNAHVKVTLPPFW